MSALTDLFGNIADAIRYKRGTSSSIVASNFPSEIMNIPSSGDYLVLTDQSPTHWGTEVATGRDYTQDNGYGTWEITAPEYDRSDYGVNCAFDDLVETMYLSNEHTVGDDPVIISQYFPMLIKPKNVFISNYRFGYSLSGIGECYLEFQKQDNSWERLATFTYGGSHTSGNDEKSIDLSTTSWYKGMRLVWNCTTNGKLGIRRFRITEGYWKEA